MANIGSLFKKTKQDPEFLHAQENVRQSLLKTLSRAIKEVQLLSTDTGEGGRVGDCRATQRLCTRFENVLRHGQKARWFGKNSSFWPLVLQISRKQAIEYINGLQYAQTGAGKCRAWIRMAVNECSLESYIGVICQNNSLRSQHYEGYAFMRDEDMVGPLQQLLGGLSLINFNITVDTASLEFEAVPEALQPPLRLRVPQHLLDNKDHHRKKRRHKPSSRPRDHQVTPIEDSSNSTSSDDEQWSDQEEHKELKNDEKLVANRHTIKISGDSTVTAATVAAASDAITYVSNHSSNDRVRESFEKERFSTNSLSQLSSLVGSTSECGSGVGSVEGRRREGGEEVVESGEGGEERESGEMVISEGVELGGKDGEEFVVNGESGEKGENRGEDGEMVLIGEGAELGEGGEVSGEGGDMVILSGEGGEVVIVSGEDGEVVMVSGESGEEGESEEKVISDVEEEENGEQAANEGAEYRDGVEEEGRGGVPALAGDGCNQDNNLDNLGNNQDNLVNNWDDHLDDDLGTLATGIREGEDLEEETEEDGGKDTMDDSELGLTSISTVPSHLEPSPALPQEARGQGTTNDCSTQPPPHLSPNHELPVIEPGVRSRNPFDLLDNDLDVNRGDLSMDIETPPPPHTPPPHTPPPHTPPPHTPPPHTPPPHTPPPHTPPPHTPPHTPPDDTTGSTLYPFGSHDSPNSHSPPCTPMTTLPLPLPHPPPVGDEVDTLTTDTAHTFPAPPSQPHTIHTSHPHTAHLHDSATSSPPASPTSSDFFNESPSATSCDHRQLMSDEVRRASRADSLELSMFMEQTLEEQDSPALLSALQLEEDHYSAEMGIPELQEAISCLKRELSSPSSLPPSELHTLRRSIVQLQLKLQSKKEDQESSAPHEEVSGHKFVQQPRQTRVLRGLSCLVCKKRVRGLIREWYQCKTCQNVCHKKCLPSVINQCVVPGEDVKYILEVCPEAGLTAQQFRCVKCNRGFNQASVEVRLCDYDGLYYCPECHSNDMAIIPARVMHNWDFNMRTVCSQCSSLLLHLSSRPLLRVQEVNPLLYIHVQDLVEVEALRNDILQMKKFFVKCKMARDSQLLHKLDVFPNFKEDTSLLTLHEMVEIQNGSLLPLLKDVHRSFAFHIQTECQVCSKRSQVCNLCSSAEPLYPFGHDITLCPHCSAVYHKNCFSEVSSCSKCHRAKT